MEHFFWVRNGGSRQHHKADFEFYEIGKSGDIQLSPIHWEGLPFFCTGELPNAIVPLFSSAVLSVESVPPEFSAPHFKCVMGYLYCEICHCGNLSVCCLFGVALSLDNLDAYLKICLVNGKVDN